MHDEAMDLLDAHLRRLQAVRDQLAAARRVVPGERREVLLQYVTLSECFTASARTLLAGSAPTRVPEQNGDLAAVGGPG